MLDSLWAMLAGSSEQRSTMLFATRQRLLTFTSVLTCVIAAVWVTLTSGTVIEGRPLVAVACGVTPFLFIPFPFLALRKSVDLDILAHAFVATLFLVVTFVAGALGGVVSTTSFFLMLVPLLATLLLGIRSGLAWFGIVAFTYAGLHFGRGWLPASAYETLGVQPLDWIMAQDVSLWNAAMMTLLALASSLSVANFRTVVQKSSAMLMNVELEARGAEEARLAANEISRSKSEFIANVSHELRTPLNAIIGYSELLLENARDQGRDADAIDNQHVLDAAGRLLATVNQILYLSAIDAGRHQLNIDECDVNALIRDVVVATTTSAHANGNEIVVELFGQDGLWLCDGPKIDHCLRNMVSNAAKFTRDGSIAVRVGRDVIDGRSWLRLDVIDTGIGIDAAQLDMLFRPFTWTDPSVTRQHQGVGLGLAVTRQLARLMGGDVTVASSVGRGSQFTLCVPAEYVPGAA